jgi:uncharacterized protein YbjT (DUF2867 family)
MRVLVSGAAAFLGAHLSGTLLSASQHHCRVELALEPALHQQRSFWTIACIAA